MQSSKLGTDQGPPLLLDRIFNRYCSPQETGRLNE